MAKGNRERENFPKQPGLSRKSINFKSIQIIGGTWEEFDLK